ncbi:MAG: hypothetical protein Q3985_00365 [Eubacteriales bacterium]|nr:hypothetical protein [Eubacteriales bacterium]
MIQRLKKNPAALQSVMQSQDGQKLMQMLSGTDGGTGLNRAAAQAAGGNTADMVKMLKQVMSSPEGAALVQRIGQSLQK